MKILDWLTGAECSWCVVLVSHLWTPSHCEYLISLTSVFCYIAYLLWPLLHKTGDIYPCITAATMTHPACFHMRHGAWSVKVNTVILGQQASGDHSYHFDRLYHHHPFPLLGLLQALHDRALLWMFIIVKNSLMCQNKI